MAPTKLPLRVERLVEFNAGLLKVNADTVTLLTESLDTNGSVPVAIVSAIGSPGCGKTLLMNSLCKLLLPHAFRGRRSKRKELKLFPERSDANGKYFNDLRGRDAILVTVPPLAARNSDGTYEGTMVILMDIWSWEPSPESYAKMADFCVAASSVLIYCGGNTSSTWPHPVGNPETFQHYFNGHSFMLLPKYSRWSFRGRRKSEDGSQKIRQRDNMYSPIGSYRTLRFSDLNAELTEAIRGGLNCFSVILNSIMTASNCTFGHLSEHLEKSGGCHHPRHSLSDSSTVTLLKAVTEKVGDCKSHKYPAVIPFHHSSTLPSGSAQTESTTRSQLVEINGQGPAKNHTKVIPISESRRIVHARELYWERMKDAFVNSKKYYFNQDELQDQHEITVQDMRLCYPSTLEEDVSPLYEKLCEFHADLHKLLQNFYGNWTDKMRGYKSSHNPLHPASQPEGTKETAEDPEGTNAALINQVGDEHLEATLNVTADCKINDNDNYSSLTPSQPIEKETEEKCNRRKDTNGPRVKSETVKLYWKKMIEFYENSKSFIFDQAELQNYHEIVVKSLEITSDQSKIMTFYTHLSSFHSLARMLIHQVRENWVSYINSTLIVSLQAGTVSTTSTQSEPFDDMLTLASIMEKPLEVLQNYENSFLMQLVPKDESPLQSLFPLMEAKLTRLEENEEKIAVRAAQVAAQEFQRLSREILGTVPWPNNELRSALMKVFETTVSLFSASMPLEPSCEILWDAARVRLVTTLKRHIHDLIIQNQSRVSELDRCFGKVRHSCRQYYKRVMKENLPKYRVNPEQFQRIHQLCVKQTKMHFREQCKDIDSEVVVDYWWDCVMAILQEMMNKNTEEKGPLPESTSANGSAQALMPKVVQSETKQPEDTCYPKEVQQPTVPPPVLIDASVAIYVSPEMVKVLVLSTNQASLVNKVMEFSPFVAFHDGQVLISDESKSITDKTGSIFNVYELISSPHLVRSRLKITLSGKTFHITGDEAVALFFAEAKLKTEKELRLRLSTCAIVASNLLPSAGKSCLIESHQSIGFKKVKFFPATIAMAMGIPLPHASSRRPLNLVCIHSSGFSVDVSDVQVTPGAVKLIHTEIFSSIQEFLIRSSKASSKNNTKGLMRRTSSLKPRVDALVLMKGIMEDGITTLPALFGHSELVVLEPETVLMATDPSIHTGGGTTQRSIVYSAPYLLSIEGRLYEFPRERTVELRKLKATRKPIDRMVVKEGFLRSSGIVTQWTYEFQIVPPCSGCNVELSMTRDGCFSLRMHNSRSMISSTSSKFLTLSDINGFSALMSSILKQLEIMKDDS